MQRNAIGPSDLNGSHSGLGTTGCGHLHQLIEADRGHLASLADQARIGREDTRNIGVELARIGLEGVGKRNGGRVGTTATKEGDVVVRRHALRAGDDRHLAGLECFEHTVRADLKDLCVAMDIVGDEPGL